MPDTGPVQFVDQKEPEPENFCCLLVGSMSVPLRRQDFLVLHGFLVFWFWLLLVHKSNAAIFGFVTRLWVGTDAPPDT